MGGHEFHTPDADAAMGLFHRESVGAGIALTIDHSAVQLPRGERWSGAGSVSSVGFDRICSAACRLHRLLKNGSVDATVTIAECIAAGGCSQLLWWPC